MTTEATVRQVANSYAAGLLPDQCVLWPFSRDSRGYGQMRLDGRTQRAHRVVLALTAGEPPDDAPHALHSCDVPACFNPKHLRWGSHSENMRDMVERDRHPMIGVGENHARAKLTDADVAEIRRVYVKGRRPRLRELAEQFGVSISQIHRIVNGRQR